MLPALRTLLARPGARAAAHNFGWLLAEKAARLVLNVGVGIAVARHLGPSDFGSINYALAVVGIVALFAELGLDSVVRRELIQAPARAIELVATVSVLRLGGGALAYVILVTGVQFAWVTPAERSLLLVFGLTLFQPAAIVADLWLQARLRAKLAVGAQLAALVVGAAVRVILIVTDAGLVGFAWAAVVETALAALLLAILARRDGLEFKFSAFQKAVAVRLLHEAWPLMLSGFAVMLYLRIDAIMLRQLVGEAEVGIYAAATRFTEVWFFVPVALASSLLPSLLRARERGAKAYATRMQVCYDLNAGIAYALAVPIALASPWLVRVAYGSGYAAAAPVVQLHIWSSIFVFLGVARGQFLVNENYTRFYLCSTVAGLLVNVALNLVLIPLHGAWGAALATVVGQGVAAWGSTFCFAPVRSAAWMQSRALLLPLNWYRYVKRN